MLLCHRENWSAGPMVCNHTIQSHCVAYTSANSQRNYSVPHIDRIARVRISIRVALAYIVRWPTLRALLLAGAVYRSVCLGRRGFEQGHRFDYPDSCPDRECTAESQRNRLSNSSNRRWWCSRERLERFPNRHGRLFPLYRHYD